VSTYLSLLTTTAVDKTCWLGIFRYSMMLVFSRRVDHDINIRTWNIQPNAQSQRRTQFMLSDAAACVQSTCGWSSVPITLIAGPSALALDQDLTIKRWWKRSFISYKPKNVIEIYDTL